MKKFGILFFGSLILLISSLSFSQLDYYHRLLGLSHIPPYTWTGRGADANWSNTQNWSTYVVPGAGQVANFSDACTTNCSPVLDSDISVAGFDIKSTYSGSITQGAYNITIGSSGWLQEAGSFIGGTGQFTINGGLLTLSGNANFRATSSETFFSHSPNGSKNIISVATTSILNFPDNSTQRFALASACGTPSFNILSSNKISFYNLSVGTSGTGCGNSNFGSSTGQYEIRGNFSHTSTTGLNYLGAYEVFGNVISNYAIPGYSTWYIKGAANTTYTGAGGLGYTIIEKTGGASYTPSVGTISHTSGGLDIRTGIYTFSQSHTLTKQNNGITNFFKVATGTVVNVPTDSTLNFILHGDCGSPTYNIDVDSIFNFENVTIGGNYSGCGAASVTAAIGDTLVVKKDLTLSNQVNLNFNLIVEGSLLQGTGAPVGNMGLFFTAATNETAAMASTFTQGSWSVDKAGSTLQFLTAVNIGASGQDLSIQNGTVNMNGYNLTVGDVLTIGINGKLLCNGGTVSALSYVLDGEFSCGPTIGITWTGATGDGLWTTAGNWTNNTVPGSNDIAVFNSKCSGANCNVTINSNIIVKGINILSSYPGIITQGASSLSIGTSGWKQAAGTFNGGTGPITLNSATFTLSGGTFQSTSGTVSTTNHWTVSGTGIFLHNSGTVSFSGSSNSINFTPGTSDYFNVIFSGWITSVSILTNPLNVLGLLTLADTHDGSGGLNTGTINVYGNLTTTSFGKNGTALIKMVGSTNQTITGVTNGAIPNLEIASTGGVVSFVGTLVLKRNFTYTSGVVDAGTSVLRFHTSDWSSATVTPGSVSYNDVMFTGYGTNYNIIGTFNIYGTTTLADWHDGGGGLNTGTIHIYGNLTTSSYGKNGTALVKIVGNTNQTITGILAGNIPNLEIASTGGIVSFVGTLLLKRNFTYTSGVVDAGTSVLRFHTSDWATATVTPGSVSYNDVMFTGYGTNYNIIGTFNIYGTTTLADWHDNGGGLNTGTIHVYGNLTTSSYGKNGTALVKIVGNTNQTITGILAGNIPNLEIASTGGIVSFVGTLLLKRNFTYTSGVVDAGTSVLRFHTSDWATATVTPGSVDYYSVTFAGYGTNYNIIGTFNTYGTLNLSDGHSSGGSLNNGIFNAYGSVLGSNNGKAGNSTITMLGTTTTTLGTSTTAKMLSTNLVINKTGGGVVNLSSDTTYFTTGQDITVTSGTLNLSGYLLNVNDILTIDSGAVLICNGGEFTVGTLVNNGTINCPGYPIYPFHWTGAGADSDWNTSQNWSGGVAPGTNDVAVFSNAYCGANCNATIGTAISVKGVQLFSDYTGTITQNSGVSKTIGNRGWSQLGGTFLGSDVTNMINGIFRVSGGLYRATSGTTLARGNLSISSATLFNHNSGIWEQNANSRTYTLPTTSNVTFNQLTFNGAANEYASINFTAGSTIVVENLLTLGPIGYEYGGFSSGTIDVKGNINLFDRGARGNTVVKLSGTGDQTITGSGNGHLPSVNIDKPSGILSLVGEIVIDRDFTYTMGTVNAGTSTVRFRPQDGAVRQHYYNGLSLNNVTYGTVNIATNLNNTTLNIDGTLLMNNNGFTLSNGTLRARGNVHCGTGTPGSLVSVIMEGTNNVNLSSDVALNSCAGLTIAKSAGGTVTMTTNYRMNSTNQDLTINSGTLNMNGFALTVNRNITNNGTLQRGVSPACGTLTFGGTYTGNAAICP